MIKEWCESGVEQPLPKATDKQIEKLKSEGNWIRANGREFLKQKFSLKDNEGIGTAGGATKAAKAYTGANDVAGDPGQMLNMLGPWGLLIKLFLDVTDKANKMGAELQQAAGATGQVTKGFSAFRGLALDTQVNMLSLSNAFGMMGMNAEQVFKDAGELVSAGVKLDDVLGPDGMTDTFKNLEGMAIGTGQSLGTVAKQFNNIINTAICIFILSTNKFS